MSEILEKETIGAIPADQRSGRARDLFFVWFGANMFFITVVTGGLSTTVFGLGLPWAMLAMIGGMVCGGLFMALHAAQGAKLGVPQMIQSRGQFGSYGTFLIVVVVTITFMGWFAANLAVAGAAFKELAPAISSNVAVIILAITNVLVAVVGYKMVHRATKLATVTLGLAFFAALIYVIFSGNLTTEGLLGGGFSWTGFLGMFSVSALWVVAYAPYVSDYSRYLPADTGPKAAFWATYGGVIAGTLVPMTLGAIVGTTVIDGNVMGGLVQMTGWLGVAILWAGVIFSGLLNAFNLYGATLCTITAIQTFKHSFVPRALGRTVVAVILGSLATVTAIAGSDNFLGFLTDIVGFMFFVLVPWTAVNLVDYYLVKHANYDVASFYAPNGGVYGKWNGLAMSCYALGILVQIPFLATTVYTGPLTTAMGGIDISWLVGLIISGGVYFVVARARAARSAPAELVYVEGDIA